MRPLAQNARLFDVLPGDQRFLMTRPVAGSEDAGPGSLILVENFFDELEEVLSR